MHALPGHPKPCRGKHAGVVNGETTNKQHVLHCIGRRAVPYNDDRRGWRTREGRENAGGAPVVPRRGGRFFYACVAYPTFWCGLCTFGEGNPTAAVCARGDGWICRWSRRGRAGRGCSGRVMDTLVLYARELQQEERKRKNHNVMGADYITGWGVNVRVAGHRGTIDSTRICGGRAVQEQKGWNAGREQGTPRERGEGHKHRTENKRDW
ncbi:hypothetical protein C8Q78DRAFT_380540 [Trametes maxima]|nr:hypothetical protein C8Q78DRAFT_380540 [Trametes maxima]